ncbi:MAG: hypothetical protein D6696_02245 [Acidobacteria bacterium]|nr:MAG: hypothetical protein D6696_02245 [Acidobacteriota bacterium]
MEKRWQKSEIAHLKRHGKSKSVEELAQRLHTDPETVQRKLEELGLVEGAARREADDPAVGLYEQALGLIYDKKWAKAAKLLEQVIEESDARQLRDRARQHLAICRRQTAKPVRNEDAYFQAVVEKNRGNLKAALALCDGAAADDERFAYLAAAIHARMGSAEEALAQLAVAIRLEPKNRVHAYHDPDFEPLRQEEASAAALAELLAVKSV